MKDRKRELKPCPFCGSSEVMFVNEKISSQWLWRAECMFCGCRTGYCWTPEAVCKTWNKRTFKPWYKRFKKED